MECVTGEMAQWRRALAALVAPLHLVTGTNTVNKASKHL